MAVTLDPILDAAQANQERKPLCRILSLENVDPIPFDGEYLSTATPNEQHPAAGVHSSGRLFVAFAVDSGATDTVRYGYTDTERTFFTYVDFVLGSGRVAGEVAAIELADGFVGLVWTETYSGTRSVKYRIITVDGAEVDPPVTGTILTNPTADFFAGPTVAMLSDDSYLMAYGLMDGSDYKLYFRTSADFETWSAAAEVDLSALDSEMRKANPHLLAFSTGEVWLLFDYVEMIGPNGEELTNIYYVSSSDVFATTSAAAALTAYTEYGSTAEHPVTAESIAGQVYLVFDRVVSSLRIDNNSTGWCYAGGSPISNMHIDVARQKLYAVSSSIGAGSRVLYCVIKVDLETWSIDDCWSTSSVPAFPDYLGNTGGVWFDSYRGAGEYVPVGHANGVISVLNGETDTITTYSFYDFSAYGIAQNITWTIPPGFGNYQIAKIQIDVDTNRIYIALVRTYFYNLSLIIGWIDLDAAGPTYTFVPIVSTTYPSSILNEGQLRGVLSNYGWMEINPSAGLIIVSMEGIGLNWSGKLQIFDLSTGGLWKEYNVDANPTFPYRGLRRGMYNNGIIVGDFTYEPLYNNADYRGLCIIDTTTDVVTYNRPPYASVNEYGLGNITMTDDGEYIIAADGSGVVIFDGTSWRLYNNAALPGLTPTGEDEFNNPVAYNPVTRMIIAGHGDNWFDDWSGLVMFSRDGHIRQANYIIGTPGAPWAWSEVAPLVRGYTDYEASITFDPDDAGLYAFWTNQRGTELSIKWDKALMAFDVTSYLLRGSSVERFSTIDPVTGFWDAGLSFECSHGHLFDASNGLSLLRTYLAMGRKVEVQFGDRVGATDYWEPARAFTVSSDAEVDYSRGDYPAVRVECETPRRRWSQIHIIASDYYQTTPELIIADLLETYANIDPVNIVLGTWPNSAEIEYQFVDVMLADAIDMIAIHFGYSIRDGAAGVIEAVKIASDATPVRTYADNRKLIKATPRGRLSSLVNRWIVECEERTFTELLMAEELAAELHASHRWNTGTKNYRVYYTHGNKIYRHPRMEVLDSVQSLGFRLAGGTSETLRDNSYDETDFTLWETYCTIRISSPDLTPAFIAALATLVGSYFIPDIHPTTNPGPTIRIGSYVGMAAIFAALNILASTGNFSYRVYGQPVAKVRRTVQASADDLDSQINMGQVIAEQPFKDALCGSSFDCQLVADFRKMVGVSERKRWTAEMVADLYIEDGDTVSVIHPVSSQPLTVFLTDMKITYQKPNAEDGSGGGIFSTFEGWRL